MTQSKWKNFALEILGCVVSALGLYNFAVAADVPVTGVAGISSILFRLFGIPIGLSSILINIPIIVFCYKTLGRDFLLRSVRCMIVFALVTDYLAPLLPVYSGDRMQAVHMLPGYTHNIINTSTTQDLVTLMWANEPFDPQKPDTFFEPV